MSRKRVECNQCDNFIGEELRDKNNYISKISRKASCKLGKKVMFRKPVYVGYWVESDGGYFRYCDEYKTTKRVET